MSQPPRSAARRLHQTPPVIASDPASRFGRADGALAVGEQFDDGHFELSIARAYTAPAAALAAVPHLVPRACPPAAPLEAPAARRAHFPGDYGHSFRITARFAAVLSAPPAGDFVRRAASRVIVTL